LEGPINNQDNDIEKGEDNAGKKSRAKSKGGDDDDDMPSTTTNSPGGTRLTPTLQASSIRLTIKKKSGGWVSDVVLAFSGGQ
jgi:hypothetical protein